MKLVLHKQVPKVDKKGLTGYVDGDEKSLMMVTYDGKLLAELENPRLKFIGKEGMCFYGYEPISLDRFGVKRTKYQEWFLRNCETGAQVSTDLPQESVPHTSLGAENLKGGD